MRAKGRHRNQTLELEQPLALAEGTEVEIDIHLAAGTQLSEEHGWADLGMSRLEEEWSNLEDAVYDDWKEVYGVQLRVEIVGEVPQVLGVFAELSQRLGLELTDPLPGEPEDVPDLGQRVGVAVSQSVPHFEYAALPVGEAAEGRGDALPQLREDQVGILRKGDRQAFLRQLVGKHLAEEALFGKHCPLRHGWPSQNPWKPGVHGVHRRPRQRE